MALYVKGRILEYLEYLTCVVPSFFHPEVGNPLTAPSRRCKLAPVGEHKLWFSDNSIFFQFLMIGVVIVRFL